MSLHADLRARHPRIDTAITAGIAGFLALGMFLLALWIGDVARPFPSLHGARRVHDCYGQGTHIDWPDGRPKGE